MRMEPAGYVARFRVTRMFQVNGLAGGIVRFKARSPFKP